MASANMYADLIPMFKESYAGKAMATHKRPGKEEKFKKLKEKLKKRVTKS